MDELLTFTYTISGDDFTRAGEASSAIKNKLKMLGVNASAIRKVAIAMYEGEINMVIHANGGEITVTISDTEITMVLADVGPGIEDISKAMQEGYSTCLLYTSLPAADTPASPCSLPARPHRLYGMYRPPPRSQRTELRLR